MAVASFSFTRDLLSLPDLDIVSTPNTADYVLETFGRPGRVPINTVASSGLVHGDVVIRSRLQQATIPISFLVQGDTVADVESGIEAAEECFAQFTYAATWDINGVGRGYSCDPSPVQSETVVEGYVRARIARLSVVLSVYPLAAS